MTGPADGVAMVFQSFALFPWLSVLDNVEIGLRAIGVARRDPEARAGGDRPDRPRRLRVRLSQGVVRRPPSPPSTTMKSGSRPVSSIALAIPNHSHGWPTQNLKPTGLPPESWRSRAMNLQHLRGRRERAVAGRRDAVDAVSHAARVGDLATSPSEPGSTPPWPGLAP